MRLTNAGTPTLLRRVVLALMLALSAAWLALLAFRVAELLVFEEQAVGLPATAAGLSKALAMAGQPAEARAMAMAAERLSNELRAQDQPPGQVLVQLSDRADGRLLYASAALGGEPMGGLAPGVSAHHRLLGMPYAVHRVDSGRWSLLVAMPRLQPPWLVATLVPELTKYMLVALPFLLLPVWLAASRGLQPLQRLSRHIAARSADDLSPVGIDARYAELLPLVGALDRLLAQLRGKVQREHAFVQDAAHELRTPMAVVSAQAHVLLKASGEPQREEAAARMELAISRASRLVEQLLALARMEFRPAPGGPALVDVAALARQAVAQCAPAAVARDVDLALDAPAALLLPADAHALQSVLHNLLDNAVRHGREGGCIEVLLSVDDDALLLSVADDGPGIAPAERALVFERFYRCADPQAPGSGLGLAIVRQAVNRMAGSVRLGKGLNGRGCRFTVRVALPPAAGVEAAAA